MLPEHSQQLKTYLFLELLWQDFINSSEYLKNHLSYFAQICSCCFSASFQCVFI